MTDLERHIARRRLFLLAQMYNVWKRQDGVAREVPGSSLWGSPANKEVVDLLVSEGLVEIHAFPTKKHAYLTTLTPSGIEEGRAALAGLYLTGERDPGREQRNVIPDWMSVRDMPDDLPGELP